MVFINKILILFKFRMEVKILLFLSVTEIENYFLDPVQTPGRSGTETHRSKLITAPEKFPGNS